MSPLTRRALKLPHDPKNLLAQIAAAVDAAELISPENYREAQRCAYEQVKTLLKKELPR